MGPRQPDKGWAVFLVPAAGGGSDPLAGGGERKPSDEVETCVRPSAPSLLPRRLRPLRHSGENCRHARAISSLLRSSDDPNRIKKNRAVDPMQSDRQPALCRYSRAPPQRNADHAKTADYQHPAIRLGHAAAHRIAENGIENGISILQISIGRRIESIKSELARTGA